MTNRRKFLQMAIAGMGMPLVPKALAATVGAPFASGRWGDVTDKNIWTAAWTKRFTNSLPWALSPNMFGTFGFIYNPDGGIGDTYTIHAGQVEWDVLGIKYGDVPALMPPLGKGAGDAVKTTVWGYGNGELPIVTHPGRSFVVRSGVAINVNWKNELVNGLGDPLDYPLPVDQTSAMQKDPGGTDIAGVPIAVHLHGGDSADRFDGGPDQWLTPRRRQIGPGVGTGNSTFDTALNDGHLRYAYDNKQEAGLLWYHDHAEGLTRTNAYAGLAGAYVIRDANEDYLVRNAMIPSGPYEHILVLQDKIFAADGSFAYPGDPALYPVPLASADVNNKPTQQLPNPGLGLPSDGVVTTDQVVGTDALGNPIFGTYTVDRSNPTHFPEMFGDVICVNGVAWPCLKVEPREYRLRLLNGSDSRFFTLQFGKLPVWHIATELGMNPTPVQMPRGQVTIGPGERMDVVVDFGKALKEGFRRVVVTNSAATPFPLGAAVVRNSGPDMVMAFDIGLPLHQLVPNLLQRLLPTQVTTLGANLRLRGWDAATPRLSRRPAVPAGAKVRRLILAEGADQYGRIMPLLGVFRKQGDGAILDANGLEVEGTLAFADAPTELPRVGDTEVWEFWNISADAHPLHMHLVRFRVLDRQPFFGGVREAMPMKADGRTGVKFVDSLADPVTFVDPLTGLVSPPVKAPGWEEGWKDTVVCLPDQVTRVVVTFDRPGDYVYHCHILSHEERDMMRWYRVVPKPVV